jgi:hypothetical protein
LVAQLVLGDTRRSSPMFKSGSPHSFLYIGPGIWRVYDKTNLRVEGVAA